MIEAPPLPGPHQEALAWIVGELGAAGVPFQLTGGAAAFLYGSRRALADLDFDVPDEALPALAARLASDVVWGPARYLGQGWDLPLLTLRRGVEIDLAGLAKVWDRAAGRWREVPVRWEGASRWRVGGVELAVVPRDELLAYKRWLDREVDRLDVETLTRAGPA